MPISVSRADALVNSIDSPVLGESGGKMITLVNWRIFVAGVNVTSTKAVLRGDIQHIAQFLCRNGQPLAVREYQFPAELRAAFV